MLDNFFEKDEYWKLHKDENLELDNWTCEYKNYFETNIGKCLDLGCGTGELSKILMSYGNDVVSADISESALEKVKEFNKDVVKFDMREKFPFENSTFDIVFANLSIHYFSESTTNQIIAEVKRILKNDGLFVGTVNGLEKYDYIKNEAQKIEDNYWLFKGKYMRLFDKHELNRFLKDFKIELIEKREAIRFDYKKNYWVFFAKK